MHTPTKSRIGVYVCGVGGIYMRMQSCLHMCLGCVCVHTCVRTRVCLHACVHVRAGVCVYDEVYSSV